MKKILLVALFAYGLSVAKSQSVGIGTTIPNSNAMLDVTSTNQGVLIPRMDSIHRRAIPNTVGMLVYDSTSTSFWYNDGVIWHNINGASGISGGGASLEYPDGTNNITPVFLTNLSTTPYTVPAGMNFYIQHQNVPSGATINTQCGGSFSNGGGSTLDLGFALLPAGGIISGSNTVVIIGFLARATVTPISNLGSPYTVPAGKILVILSTGYMSASFTINSKTFNSPINAGSSLPVVAKAGDIITAGGLGCFFGYLR